MSGSWTLLDPEQVEKEVNNSFKVMNKMARVLQQKELPACAANCTLVKASVEEFKPYVPLVQVRPFSHCPYLSRAAQFASNLSAHCLQAHKHALLYLSS